MYLLFFFSLAPATVTESNKLRPFSGLRGIFGKCGEINSWSVSVKVHLSHPGGFNFLHRGAEVLSMRQSGGNYNWKTEHSKTLKTKQYCWFICVCLYISVYVYSHLSNSLSLQRLTLLHVNSNQCLDMPSEEDKMVPTLRDCNNSRSQQWLLRNMTLSVWSLTSPSLSLSLLPLPLSS